jgi:hypothetical protein
LSPRAWKGLAVACALAGALSIIGPSPIDPCQWDWVQNSAFLRWVYDCGNAAGGGSSGAV